MAARARLVCPAPPVSQQRSATLAQQARGSACSAPAAKRRGGSGGESAAGSSARPPAVERAAGPASMAPPGQRFYGCYLLHSLDPEARVRNYIG